MHRYKIIDMKNIIIVVLAIVVVGGGFYYINNKEVVDAEYVADAALPADSIVGVWQSTQDPNFIRAIYENGGYLDTYTGEEASTEGPWVVFMADAAPAEFPYPTEEGAEYLELQDVDGSLHFKVAERTEEKLVLIYLDRGNVLEFTRVQ